MNEKTVVIDRTVPLRADEQVSHEEHPGFRTASLIARVVLGAVMLIAGAEKLGALEAFGANIYNYQILPVELVNIAALLLVWAEIAVGVMLIAGAAVRGSALVSTVMLALFIIAIGSAMARGLKIDCGCFAGKTPAASATPTTGTDISLTTTQTTPGTTSPGTTSGTTTPGPTTEATVPAKKEAEKVGWPKLFEDLGLLALAIFLVYYPRSYLAVDNMLRREDRDVIADDAVLARRTV
ncbi:MAG: DoxX family membrane protein [bacterium]|nr:DoxX family membrane protein [Candidatus Kapabacteria bacterium]